MILEVGKYYKHTKTHSCIHILDIIDTAMWGMALVAETSDGYLRPIGRNEISATNYIEVSEEEWGNNLK